METKISGHIGLMNVQTILWFVMKSKFFWLEITIIQSTPLEYEKIQQSEQEFQKEPPIKMLDTTIKWSLYGFRNIRAYWSMKGKIFYIINDLICSNRIVFQTKIQNVMTLKFQIGHLGKLLPNDIYSVEYQKSIGHLGLERKRGNDFGRNSLDGDEVKTIQNLLCNCLDLGARNFQRDITAR